MNGVALLMTFFLSTGAQPSASLVVVSSPGLGPATLEPVMSPTDSLPGIWEGVLKVPGGGELTVVFHIQRAEDGGFSATMDSPDQGAKGIPVSEVRCADGLVRLVSTAVNGVFEGRLAADGTRMQGEWRQSGAALPLELERVEQVTARPRPQDPRPPFPYRVEEVQYPNGRADIELAGALTLPEGEGPFPAVVLISGSGPQDRDESVFGHRPFSVLADHLTRNGIAVLRFDDRGVGGSTGDQASATSEDFATDVRAGVAYLRSRGEVDDDRIGLIGHSEGGLIAPLVAAETDEVGFIVLLAGPGLPGDTLLMMQSELIGKANGSSAEAIARNIALQRRLFAIIAEEPDPARAEDRLRNAIRVDLAGLSEGELEGMGLRSDDAIEAFVSGQARQVNSAWLRHFVAYDPRPTLERVRVPVLALNGELDLQVPAEANVDAMREAFERGGNSDFTLGVLPGLNHLFQEAETGSPAEYARIEQTIAPAALESIAAWILERFGG
jgi:pimeloyl-ACP methyl ester carboxylesterase